MLRGVVTAPLTTPHLLTLPERRDTRGRLIFAHSAGEIPFAIARYFLLTDLPAGGQRGGHAHRRASQCLQCASGRCHVTCCGRAGVTHWTLEDPQQALLIPPLHWAVLAIPDPGTTVVAFTDHPYDAAEYIRDFEEFRAQSGFSGDAP